MTKTEHLNKYYRSSSRLRMPKDVEGNKRRSEKHAESTRKRVICVETGEIFISLTELASSIDSAVGTLSSYMRKEIPYKGLNYKYV